MSPNMLMGDISDANVAEAAALYDTVVICETLYGKEKTLPGWFTSWRDFSAQEKHTFFKSRTSGNCHLAYCNMDGSDILDFAFRAYSFGVRFFAPVMPDQVDVVVTSPGYAQEGFLEFFLGDLPQHCGIDLRVQQDVVIENNAMANPPGYGPRGSGGASPIAAANAVYAGDVPFADPFRITIGNQGIPEITNRFPLETPIVIARNSNIEANLYVSAYARHVLSGILGPKRYVFPSEFATSDTVPESWISHPVRYGIQVSLFGERLVQQRGQYHV